MAPEIMLREARAVRAADEVDALGADRLAHLVEVAHGVLRRVVARVAVDRREAGTEPLGEALGGRDFLGHALVAAAFVFALELVRAAGAALVHQDHVTLLQHAPESRGDRGIGLERGLAGAAGEEEHRIGLGPRGRALHERDAERDLPAGRRVRVLRHLEVGALGLEHARLELLLEVAGLELERAELACAGSSRQAQGEHRECCGKMRNAHATTPWKPRRSGRVG